MEKNTTAEVLNASLTPNISQNQQTAKFDQNSIWQATTVVLIFMIIAIVFGNVLVLMTTWLDKRLHQPNKYFVACLAVADLFVGMFSVPIRLYLHLNSTILAPIQLCRFWSWIDICCEVASIVTLTVISIDRYFKISRPFQYRSQMVTTKSVLIICMIWLISGAHATLGMFSYDNSLGVVAFVGRGCINDNKIYMSITAVLFFILPTVVIIAMYTLVFHIAHNQQKLNRRGILGRTMSSRKKKPANKEIYQELKTARMLLLVVGAFIVCWAPLFVIFFIGTYRPEYMPTNLHTIQIIGTIFIVILPSFNSLCNPIIYACFDREYSTAFKHLFQKLPCCKISSRRKFTLNRSLSTQTSNLFTRTTTMETPMSAPGMRPMGT
jgi:5-hydroxytryptamine receptor 7